MKIRYAIFHKYDVNRENPLAFVEEEYPGRDTSNPRAVSAAGFATNAYKAFPVPTEEQAAELARLNEKYRIPVNLASYRTAADREDGMTLADFF